MTSVVHKRGAKKVAVADLLPSSPFDWQAKKAPPAAPLTRAEKNRIQTKERMARARAIKLATRVNPHAGYAINSQEARDKTAKIVGRRNEARSQ